MKLNSKKRQPARVVRRKPQGSLAAEVKALRLELAQAKAEAAASAAATKGPLFSDYVPRWRKTFLATQPEPSTVDHYEKTIRLHLLPAFGDKHLGDISDELIADWQAKQRVSGRLPIRGRLPLAHKRGLSKGTVSAHSTILRLILLSAVEKAVLQRAPKINVTPDTTEQPWLEQDEADQLVRYAETQPDDILVLVLLGVDAGLRRGEVTGLRRLNVSFKKKELYVREQRARHGVRDPKHGKMRTVPMTDRLVAVLSRLEAAATDSDGYVSRTKFGKPRSYNNFAKLMHTICKRAGITRRIKYHSTRHTFISTLSDKGAAVSVIQKLAGHSHLATTQRYLHSAEDQMHRAIGLLNP